MAIDGNYSYDVRNKIHKDLQRNDGRMLTAQNIGNHLGATEERYFALLNDPDAKPGDVEKAKMKFQRALTTFKSFQEVIQAYFEVMREAGRKLNIR